MGMNYIQTGKDLSEVATIIGTGGAIIKAKEPIAILNYAISRPENINELRPHDAKYYLDYDYILSSMGLLLIEDPNSALKILKKRMKELK